MLDTNATNHAAREHAVLSPSFLHIALMCPGAVGLKESLPPEPAGAPAVRGTAMHEAAAAALEDWLEAKLEGTDPDVRLREVTDAEVRRTAEGWRDILWDEAFERCATGKVYGIEDKLTFSEKIGLWGTADFWLVSTDDRARPYGMIADLKSGYTYVEAHQNPQLAAYACALRAEVRALGKDLDYVRAAIYQPFGEGESYRETRFTAKQLDTWEKKFLTLAEKVYSPKPKFKAGHWCQYCPGRARCLTYDKHRVKETGLRLLDATEFAFPPAPTIPDEVLVRIVAHEKQLDSFMKACRKELTAKLLQGEHVPGVKLVESKTRRKWDEDKLDSLEDTLDKFDVALYEKSPRGLTAVREDLTAKVGKKEAEALMASYLIQPPGVLTLALESDKREAVTPGVGLFTDCSDDSDESI